MSTFMRRPQKPKIDFLRASRLADQFRQQDGAKSLVAPNKIAPKP